MVTYASRLPHAAGGAGLDQLAKDILSGLAPLSFPTAQTPAEVDAVLRMRYECVTEMGWAQPSDYPDGRESDEYDEDAVFVLCRAADDIVGSLRLVLPAPGRLLPTERDFGIRVQPPGDALEAGRFIIPQRRRPGLSHLVLAGLAARSWLIARERGFDRAISAATADVVELHRSLGIRVAVLGPARTYWGEERAPIEITGTEDTFSFARPAASRLAGRAIDP